MTSPMPVRIAPPTSVSRRHRGGRVIECQNTRYRAGGDTQSRGPAGSLGDAMKPGYHGVGAL
jgi:hypothetical protein